MDKDKKEKSWLKKLPLHLVIVLSIIGVISLLLGHIKNEISYQTPEDIDRSETAEQLLNHANTMYWFGRANGNTIVEFDRAAELAKEAKAKLLLRKDNDSIKSILDAKAEKIIQNARDGRRQNLMTVNNRYPYFMDLTGLNEIQEEDQEKEEMDKVTTTRVLTKLLDAPDLLSSRPLREVPYFTILIHGTKDQELEEAGVQYLNLSTNHYTISKHEIAQIVGKKDFEIEKLVQDTSFLEKVRKYFSCGQVAIVNIIKQDQYSGIFYYGARLNLYAPETKRRDLNRYVESFTKARGYNTMTGIKIPLLIVYLLVLILGMELLLLFKFFDLQRIKWHRLFLTGIISIVLNIVALEALAYFWSPESGEFIETDKVMVWIFAVSLSFSFVPIIFGHLVVGKLDRFISSFDSGLDSRAGLFSIVLPALSTYGVALLYYSILRFGFTEDLKNSIYAFSSALILSFLLTLYWKRAKELPARTSLVRRFIVYSVLIFSSFSAIMYPYSSLGALTIVEVKSNFITFAFYPAVFAVFGEILQLIPWFTKNDEIYFVKSGKSEDDDIFSNVELECESSMISSLEKDGLLVVYGAKRMGKTSLVSRLSRNLFEKNSTENVIYIDLGARQPNDEKNKINYYPFAQGFAHMLPNSAFNDHAEEARRSGNIIGKLISSITSAGDLLVDETDSIPADLDKIREILLKKTMESKKTLLVFENINEAQGESKDLFLSFLEKFYELGNQDLIQDKNIEPFNVLSLLKSLLRKDVIASDTEDNHVWPMMVFTSSLCFHINREFELMIEDIVNSRRREKEIYSLNQKEFAKGKNDPPFFSLSMDPTFLSKYLDTYKFNVFDKKYLLDQFRISEKDKSPGLIQEIFKKLIENRRICKDDLKGVYRVERSKGELGMPEIFDELEPFEVVFKDMNKELHDILRCCAYSCVRNGDFEIGVVCDLLEKGRIEILHALRVAEELNIIHDAKDRDDWYRFNDNRYVVVLKRQEGRELDEISQLGKEFYQRWVKFYWLRFGELCKDVHEHRDTLISLRERSYIIRETDPLHSFMILEKLGYFFLSPELSLLDQAEKAFEAAISITEEYDHLFELEKRYELKVNGLLRALDGKNELNTPKAQDIFNKEQKLIKEYCPEQVYWFEYLKCLAYSKSDDYHPVAAMNLVEQNKSKIAVMPQKDLRRIQLEFVNLLLIPTGKASYEELLHLAASFEELIRLVESETELLDKCKELGIYQQVLNHYGGSILSDKILGNPDLNRDEKQNYFKQSIAVLYKRMLLETDKVTEVSTVLVQTTPADTILSLGKICAVISADENVYSIDRKGLSYTLNYLTRAMYYVFTEKGITQLPENPELREVILSIAKYAEALNKDVNDQMGIIMSSTYLGYFKLAIGDVKSAFEHYEVAFAHALSIMKDVQMGFAISNMEKLFQTNEALSGIGKFERDRLDDYKYIKLYRHLLRHFTSISFSKEKTQELIRKSIIVSEEDLSKLTSIPGSKFNTRLFEDPKVLIDKVLDLKTSHASSIIEKQDGVYLELDLGTIVGTLNLIPLTDLPSGVTPIKDERDKNVIYKVENIPPPETTYLFVVLTRDRKEIISAWPGHFAPKLPSQISKDEVEDRKAAEAFWSSHAFIIEKTKEQ